jgi:hypothetical protein
MRVLLVVESCGLIHRQLTPQGRPFIMRPVIARDRVIGKNGLPGRGWEDGAKQVEWKPTPDMYRMDTPEGREAYEASFRMKIEPLLDRTSGSSDTTGNWHTAEGGGVPQ